jgi:hypothetical protein
MLNSDNTMVANIYEGEHDFGTNDESDDEALVTLDIVSDRIRDCSINSIRSVFDNAESCHIGEFMIHELAGRASKHIIQESVLGSSLYSTPKDISSNDSLLFTLLLSIGMRLSREERNKLCTMISLIQKKVEEETLISHGMMSACHVRIPLPVVSYDMRKIFESGKQQFTNYMPLPMIMSPIPGYASVSLSRTLQIMYSRGTDWDNKCLLSPFNSTRIHTDRSIIESHMASKIIQSITDKIKDNTSTSEKIILQPIVLWSDSADINKVKNNRSSIKVHNIYIPHRDGQSPHCVFPLAIGSGRSAHESYRTRMFAEVDELHNCPIMCYDNSSGMVSTVHFFLLAVVQDRPEHSEFTGTIAHNGKYGALPGYSFPRSICVGSLPGVTVLKNLVSCKACYTKRINYLCGKRFVDEQADAHNNIPCINCYDWDITKIQFKRPSKMPKDIPHNCYVDGDDTNDVLVSKKVTFESIKSCLQYIHDKTYTKQWTDYAKTVQSYASLECVNNALAKEVYDSAKSLRKLHIQEEGVLRIDLPQIDDGRLPRAVSCRNLSMSQCMVGVMHTFFLNGGKKVLTLIQDVFKKEKLGAVYLTKSKLLLKDLRTLSLSWIMAWPFGSTSDKPMAPWVSENFVAYYHVCKCHMSIVCERLILKGRGNVADSLKLLLSVWHRLLSVVMQPRNPSADEILMVDELAKLFLSRYHEMEKYLERPSKDWDLQNASCHLMLLLLPDYMNKFGCLRNYWEGGHMGERSITKLKKSLPHGAHMDGSVRTAIRRYFVDVVLSQLMENEHFSHTTALSPHVKGVEDGSQFAMDEGDTPYENVVHNNENCTKQSYDRYRRFRVYKSMHSFVSAVTEKQPLALVYLPDKSTFYVIIWELVNHCRERVLKKIDFSGGTIREGTYMTDQQSVLDSFNVDPAEDADERLCFKNDVISKATACAALPYLIVTVNDRNVTLSETHYFVRTEQHLELRNFVDVVVPVFSYPTLYAGSSRIRSIERNH